MTQKIGSGVQERGRRRLIIITCFVFGGPLPVLCAETIVVQADAEINCGPDCYTAGVAVPLETGEWRFTAGDDENDVYDGWSPWSSDSAHGGLSWLWSVRITVPGVMDQYWKPRDAAYFATQQEALAANVGGSTILNLEAPNTAYFWYSDYPGCGDNRGGATVYIDPARPNVQVDAKVHCGSDYTVSSVPLPLSAGLWRITVADNENDHYDAWSAWSSGDNWMWRLGITVPGVVDLPTWAPYDAGLFPTQQAALDANVGGSMTISLDAPATAYFWVLDSGCADNRGGMTVSVEPYWDTLPDPQEDTTEGEQGEVSGTSSDPVNTATGSFFHQETDLSIPSRGLPLTFTRFYNSKAAAPGRKTAKSKQAPPERKTGTSQPADTKDGERSAPDTKKPDESPAGKDHEQATGSSKGQAKAKEENK